VGDDTTKSHACLPGTVFDRESILQSGSIGTIDQFMKDQDINGLCQMVIKTCSV
jgi:hypothetical protein